jgi:hypothetical protein
MNTNTELLLLWFLLIGLYLVTLDLVLFSIAEATKLLPSRTPRPMGILVVLVLAGVVCGLGEITRYYCARAFEDWLVHAPGDRMSWVVRFGVSITPFSVANFTASAIPLLPAIVLLSIALTALGRSASCDSCGRDVWPLAGSIYGSSGLFVSGPGLPGSHTIARRSPDLLCLRSIVRYRPRVLLILPILRLRAILWWLTRGLWR